MTKGVSRHPYREGPSLTPGQYFFLSDTEQGYPSDS